MYRKLVEDLIDDGRTEPQYFPTNTESGLSPSLTSR